MSLRNNLFKALQSRSLGRKVRNGVYVVTREQVVDFFRGSHPETYTSVILSNSEMEASHSPTYEKFSVRLDRGKYEIHIPAN